MHLRDAKPETTYRPRTNSTPPADRSRRKDNLQPRPRLGGVTAAYRHRCANGGAFAGRSFDLERAVEQFDSFLDTNESEAVVASVRIEATALVSNDEADGSGVLDHLTVGSASAGVLERVLGGFLHDPVYRGFELWNVPRRCATLFVVEVDLQIELEAHA